MILKEIKTPKCKYCKVTLKKDGLYYCDAPGCCWKKYPAHIPDGHTKWICPKCFRSYYEVNSE